MGTKNKLSIDELEQFAQSLVSTHPFEDLTKETILSAAGSYQSMSELFPYIQGSAAYLGVKQSLETGNAISEDWAVTSPIATFLTWDEFGGHFKLSRHGIKALPTILDKNGFHSELLRKDWKKITGEYTSGRPNDETREYLIKLMHGLSDLDPIQRAAMMVSFELHANRMITALWESIVAAFKLEDKDELIYFYAHVGGDDPAEAYHVQMTAQMLKLLVPINELDRFYNLFEEAYMLHVNWCSSVSTLVEVA